MSELSTGALDLSSMRMFVNGAEPARVSSIDAFAKAFTPHKLDPAALHVACGLAEVVVAFAVTSPREPPRRLTVFDEAFR